MNDDDRRAAQRIARSFLVRYHAQEGQGMAWDTAPLRDFSETGARFLAQSACQQGDALILQLILPMSREPVWVTARVVWVKPVQWEMQELGVAFEPGDDQTKQAIAAAAAFFQKRQGH